MRLALLILGLVGTLVFGVAFVVSYQNPILIERAAREIVRIEVERRVGERFDALSDSRIAGLAQRALNKTDADIQVAQQSIRDEVPRKVANVVADMMKADCTCRRRLVEYANQAENDRLSTLVQVRAKLGELVESTYASVSRNLLREFRIFSGSNAVAFALLLLVTFFRRRAALQLALPAVVLLGAVAITGGLYLLNQNWLHTIVFGDYTGFAYTVYLGGVALLLSDVVFNRARMSTRLANALMMAVGAAATAVAC